jgi:uncharacterized protein YggE
VSLNRTFALLSLALLAVPAAAQRPMDRPEIPSLTVSGNGEVRVDPDEVTVRLGVTRQAQTAEAAQEGVNRVAQAILDALTKLGIPKDQIQTSQLTLFPVYAPQRPETPQEPRVVAYRASNTVSVRSTKLQQAGPIVDAALKAGANQVEGVSFGLRNDLPARERALRQAIEEARRKAEVMAQAADVRLGGTLQIEEGGVSIRPPIFSGGAMFARSAEAATPVSPGEVGVTASVTIRYRITDKS